MGCWREKLDEFYKADLLVSCCVKLEEDSVSLLGRDAEVSLKEVSEFLLVQGPCA